MLTIKPDGLSLEYKRDYGLAKRNLDISDVMNNPNAFGEVRVFGPGFSEKITDLPFVKIGVFHKDVANSAVVLDD
ncbi:MAG: hypothetical protein L6288_06915 [Desulfarculaceae bacterium]|nr:hypothetical protein [Desulfarculaceae bacterium]